MLIYIYIYIYSIQEKSSTSRKTQSKLMQLTFRCIACMGLPSAIDFHVTPLTCPAMGIPATAALQLIASLYIYIYIYIFQRDAIHGVKQMKVQEIDYTQRFKGKGVAIAVAKCERKREHLLAKLGPNERIKKPAVIILIGKRVAVGVIEAGI